MDTVTLNVSGKLFTIGKSALKRYPNTKLGRLTEDTPNYDPKSSEFFFDRNPKMILPIFDLYRTGELHLPSNLCTFTIKNELEFWEISEDLISECCWLRHASISDDMKAVDIIEKAFADPVLESLNSNSLKHHIWRTMEYPTYSRQSKTMQRS